MGPPKMVAAGPIQASHIFTDSGLGVGLGNSMGPAYNKGVPCPWASLKIPLIQESFHHFPGACFALPVEKLNILENLGIHTISLGNWIAGFRGFKLMEINRQLVFQDLFFEMKKGF